MRHVLTIVCLYVAVGASGGMVGGAEREMGIVVEGIAKHYARGTMERVHAKRITQGLVKPGAADGLGGFASTTEEANIGKVARARFLNPHTREWGRWLLLLVIDCSAPVDRLRHIAGNLVIEVDYETAERGGWEWDGTRGEGKTTAQVIIEEASMAFTPVKVIDKTSQTDPRVHGGLMAAGDPSGIICHHTGSKNEAGDEAYLSTFHANPVSTNQLVKRDGTIIQIVANDHVAYHAGVSTLNGRADCNGWCIGIEICNAGDGKEKFTDAQYEAVAQTVAYQCARFHIPDLNVSSHARVALPAGRKNDPRSLDWARLWKRVDALRNDWPFPIPLWFDNGDPRVMST